MESCRRRRRSTTKAPPDWLSLPPELLVEIAKFVIKSDCVEDFVAFGRVCTSWQAAARNDECAKLVRPCSWPAVPFLMLAENHARGSNEREFYSLWKKKVCLRIPVPHANNKRCIESRFGWLLTLTNLNEVDRLLNPFTGERIELPSFFGSDCYEPIKRSVLSENPSHSRDFVLVVLTEPYLAYWKPGDENWTRISPDWIRKERFLDVNYCDRNQKFYSVDDLGYIYVWDAAIPERALTLVNCIQKRLISMAIKSVYLVESSVGELLLVIRNENHFKAFRVDVSNLGLIEMIGHKDLKDAIFVGSNAAFCCTPPLHSDIKSNHIYFTDDYNTSSLGKYKRIVGIYNLENGSIQHIRQEVEASSLSLCSSLWVAPSTISLASPKMLAS